ncbi:hypothetical protein FOZ63_033703 [Perkinsus olseni]|uniref:Uncharacterized protein n=1 Tax=Perkinsus olseni TaxID=32597 RepID=A0A7J6SVR0_PEROL|nr:hypothetical protein FOZ63_033703 [Perkinsus olseni]
MHHNTIIIIPSSLSLSPECMKPFGNINNMNSSSDNIINWGVIDDRNNNDIQWLASPIISKHHFKDVTTSDWLGQDTAMIKIRVSFYHPTTAIFTYVETSGEVDPIDGAIPIKTHITSMRNILLLHEQQQQSTTTTSSSSSSFILFISLSLILGILTLLLDIYSLLLSQTSCTRHHHHHNNNNNRRVRTSFDDTTIVSGKDKKTQHAQQQGEDNRRLDTKSLYHHHHDDEEEFRGNRRNYRWKPIAFTLVFLCIMILRLVLHTSIIRYDHAMHHLLDNAYMNNNNNKKNIVMMMMTEEGTSHITSSGIGLGASATAATAAAAADAAAEAAAEKRQQQSYQEFIQVYYDTMERLSDMSNTYFIINICTMIGMTLCGWRVLQIIHAHPRIALLEMVRSE